MARISPALASCPACRGQPFRRHIVSSHRPRLREQAEAAHGRCAALEKQLAEAERSQQGKSRPKSARAARSSFRRAEASATAAADSDAVARGIDPETLRVRRALAQKLKSEVIGKS